LHRVPPGGCRNGRGTYEMCLGISDSASYSDKEDLPKSVNSQLLSWLTR
jgi:hypothetical protein